WDASPAVSSFAYQWYRCDDVAGSGCVAIGGASVSTYLLVQDDVGRAIRVRVTASNGVAPAGVADSVAVGLVTGPPANSILPTIGGTPTVGSTLTANNGTWTGYPAPTFTYQWRRCDSVGNGCADIAGQIGSSYVVVNGDKGHTLRVVVT